MRKILKHALKEAHTIEEVLSITLEVIAKVKKNEQNIKIGYVSGKVTADGQKHIADNLARMHRFTRMLMKTNGKFIFSAADIFNDEIYWKINLPRPVHEKEFYNFWRTVISSGVTDIYMTPDWEKSDGAKYEHETAKQLRINIHYVEEQKANKTNRREQISDKPELKNNQPETVVSDTQKSTDF